MIKDNQSVLNRLLVFVDALIIGGSLVLAYLVKFYILRPEPTILSPAPPSTVEKEL